MNTIPDLTVTKEIQPIHRRKVSQALIDRLLEMISDGYWKPGDMMPPQRELAKALDVGMSTLREALLSLQSMGVLEMRHGNGTYLVESPKYEIYSRMVNLSLAIGKTDLEMLFEARGVIETGFAFYAAERASPQQIEELFQILENERQAIINNDRYETYLLDISFHKKIAAISANDFLQQLVGTLFDALADILQVLPQTMEGWKWHFNVADAIRDHSPMKASEAMRTLVMASSTRLLPYLDSKSNGNGFSEPFTQIK